MTSFSLCRAVEIEVNTHCNLACRYCPNANPNYPRRREFMANEVFERLMAELSRLDFHGLVAFHFLSEPLLRLDLHKLVRMVRNRVAGAIPILYTNGTLLTEHRYNVLVEAGIARFVVTDHRGDGLPERQWQMLLKPADLLITNRGGEVSPGECLDVPCFVPSEMLFVSVEGNVFLCYEDARQQTLFGNIMRIPLDKIWESEEYKQLRSILREGRRRDGPASCRSCNNIYHRTFGTEGGSTPISTSALRTS
jgi:cyclic pyranopterin phosphate synthase